MQQLLLFVAVIICVCCVRLSSQQGELFCLFECDDGKHCTENSYVCDGDVDCPDSSDERTICRTEPVQNNFLIVCDSSRRNLFQISLADNHVFPMLPFQVYNPVAVALDESSLDVYWADTSLGAAIGRYSLRDRVSTIIYSSQRPNGTDTLYGLAVDSTRQTLYYTQNSDYNGTIGFVHTNGTGNRILFHEQRTKPRAIVLDLRNRVIYWTDCGRQHAINKANMDNTVLQKQTIVSRDLSKPVALAIDFEAEVMFWGDSSLSHIELSRLDGTGRRTVYSYSTDEYSSFTLSPQYLYISDRARSEIRFLDRRTFRVRVHQTLPMFSEPTGIVYFNTTLSLDTTAAVDITLSSRNTGIHSTSRTTTTSPTISSTLTSTISSSVSSPDSHSTPVIPVVFSSPPVMFPAGADGELTSAESHNSMSLTTPAAVNVVAEQQHSNNFIDNTMITVTSLVVGGFVGTVIIVTIGVVIVCSRKSRTRHFTTRVSPTNNNNNSSSSNSCGTNIACPFTEENTYNELTYSNVHYDDVTNCKLPPDDYMAPTELSNYYTDSFYSNDAADGDYEALAVSESTVQYQHLA